MIALNIMNIRWAEFELYDPGHDDCFEHHEH